jgi:hypothetical protein
MAYKTSAGDAAALATKWYEQGLGRAPDAEGLQHWIGEIQKDGSNTAWQNFSGSPEVQKAGAAAKFQAAGVNPIELTPGAGQLPGTNMKNITNTWGATLPPAVAEALRVAAQAGGMAFGIDPRVSGAILQNLGHGAIDNVGDVLQRGAMGALSGAMTGGAVNGAKAGTGFMGTLGGAAKGAIGGAMNPFAGSSGLNKAASAIGAGGGSGGGSGGGNFGAAPDGGWNSNAGGGNNGGGNVNTNGGNSTMDYIKNLFKDTSGGDILRTAGSAIGGYMSNEQAQAALAQRKAEFDQTSAQRKAEYERTTGNSEATSAANAEQAINRAPLADKAQYQLMARMGIAPTAFKPRDYTQGLSNIASTPTGGYGDVLDTMGGAAKSYTTGAGGINTSALSLLQNRMLANAKSPAMPATTPARTPVVVPPVVTPPVGGAGTPTGAPAGTVYTPPVDVQNMQRRSKLQLDDEENPY